MTTGKKLIKIKIFVRLTFLPKKKKKEKAFLTESMYWGIGLLLLKVILLSYKIIENSLKVIIRRCDLLNFNLVLGKKRGQEAEKLVPVIGLHQESVMRWAKLDV